VRVAALEGDGVAWALGRRDVDVAQRNVPARGEAAAVEEPRVRLRVDSPVDVGDGNVAEGYRRVPLRARVRPLGRRAVAARDVDWVADVVEAETVSTFELVAVATIPACWYTFLRN